MTRHRRSEADRERRRDNRLTPARRHGSDTSGRLRLHRNIQPEGLTASQIAYIKELNTAHREAYQMMLTLDIATHTTTSTCTCFTCKLMDSAEQDTHWKKFLQHLKESKDSFVTTLPST